MTQVGQINGAIRNAYDALKNTPEVDTKPKTTGLLTRTEKPKEKEESKEKAASVKEASQKEAKEDAKAIKKTTTSKTSKEKAKAEEVSKQ